MDASELELLELLDHLGRHAARMRVPAPRKTDSVARWCGLNQEAEACLFTYLRDQYPGARKLGLPIETKLTFGELLRELRRVG